MGGKSSPDYTGAAIQQGEANREVVRDQTFANRPDQYTPWGATTWTPYSSTDPSTGQATTSWSQTQSLTPELQDILNKQIAIQSGRSDIAGALTGRLGAEFGTPMDWRGLNPMGQVPTAQFTLPENIQRGVDYSDLPAINTPLQQTALGSDEMQSVSVPNQQTSINTSGMAGISSPEQQRTINTFGLQSVDDPTQMMGLDYSGINGVGDGSYYRDRAEDAIYNKGAGRLNDRFETQREQAEIKMRNQGLRPGDAAYQAQMQSLGQQETDAFGQLQSDAIMGGMAESNQMFQQDAARRGMYTGERDRQAQFGNQAAQNLYGMQSDLRNQGLSERQSTGQFANQASQNMFNMQSALRGQNFGEAQAQGQFGNQANQAKYDMQSGLRGQQFGEAQAAGEFGNQAAQNLYGMQSDLRNTYSNERDRAAAFYNQSGQQAFDQSSQANQQNYQQAMAGSQYANQIRQQQITEAMTKRGFSLNEINGLLSGQQVNTPQMPNFQGASAAQAAPIYQAAVDQGNYNAGMSPWNAVLGAAGTLGGAYLGNPSAFPG